MDVVVVGSCNIDLTSFIPHLPVKGETIHGYKFLTGFGGKGANQCVMAAKLGACSMMVGMVGNDDYGKGYINEFKKFNINTDFVFTTKDASTGVAPGFVDVDGNSAIVIVAGANMLLTPDDIQKAESVIAKSKVVVCQLEIPEESTVAALRLAKKYGVTTILNPAPKKADLHSDIFPLCDIFCPNETEVGEKPIETIEEAGDAALAFVDKGCGTVIITLGEKGCVFVTGSERVVHHIPVEKVEAVDTTGAGDSFVGSLAFFMAKYPQISLEEKIRRSCYIATQSVLKEGTQASYPIGSELPQRIFS